MTQRWEIAALAAGAACVALSLALRIVHRGPYLPGWDFVGAAQGLYTLSTQSPGAIVRFHWDQGYGWSWTGWALYGAPVVLVPGALAALWPWEYWGVVVTFAMALASFALSRWALRLSLAETGALLLAWGASSTLLSWSVTGLAYISGFVPHALALATVLRLPRRPLWTVPACVLIHALAWHGQELGHSVFAVLFAAAIFARGAPWTTRAIWVATGAWQLYTTLGHPSTQHSRFMAVSWPGWLGLLEKARALAVQAVSPGVDAAPFLLIAAVCALLIRRDRWFWWTIGAVQVGLVLSLGAIDPTLVWPRRFLLVSACGALAIAVLYRDSGLRGRRILAGLLVAANLWQVFDTARWAAAPLRQPGVGAGFPLPYTHSTADYSVPFAAVDWYLRLRDELAAGKKLVLLYNHYSYLENATNPTAILERLYLRLGHDGFARSVRVFSTGWRWNFLPLQRPEQAAAFADSIGNPGEWVVYRVAHPHDDPAFRAEAQQVEDALQARFDLAVTQEYQADTITATFTRFELVPREMGVPYAPGPEGPHP